MEYMRRAGITFTKERHALQAIRVLWSQQAHNTEYVDFQKKVDLQKKWNFQKFLNCHGSGGKKKKKRRFFPMEMEVTMELCRVCGEIRAIPHAHMIWKESEERGDKIRR